MLAEMGHTNDIVTSLHVEDAVWRRWAIPFSTGESYFLCG